MEKEVRGLRIAVIVLAIICILEFLIIIGDNDTTIQTDSNTTVEYAQTDENENIKKEMTDDEIKSNIKVEYAGTAINGDFVLKVTNNNDTTVIIDNIETVFKDENNVFAQKEMTYDQWFGIQAHKTTYVYSMGFQKDFSKYPNYEFNINLATSSYILEKKTADNFEVTANDSGEQIAVEIKNKNDISVENIQVNVIYYKNGKVVGIESSSDITSNATATQATSYVNVEYPEDSNYDKVDFDNYEVFLMSADICD